MDADRELTAHLGGFERFAFRLVRLVNRRAKGIFTFYQQQLLGIAFEACIGRTIVAEGLQHVRALSPDRPVLLVSNHRSFFDFFTLSTVLYKRAGFGRRIYFPVRANFFYDNPLGLLINGFIGGFSMYPPIFRDRKKLALNRASIDETARLLREPGTLVGIHPEGTRGKGPDPYELLPAQPGVGRALVRSDPVVLPVFLLGLGNSLWKTFWNNWTERRPIFVVFGEPIDVSDLRAEGDRPTVHKRIADRIAAVLRGLGERERTLREKSGAPCLAPPRPRTEASADGA